MLKKLVLAFLCFTALPALAEAPVVSLGELTRRALDNPMILQMGILGKDKDELRRVTHSTGGDIMATAQTIKLFSKAGCGRVLITVSIPNVPTQEGESITFWTKTQMNLCRDGSPATEDSNSTGLENTNQTGDSR